jgi:hypothetical protein
MCPICVWKQVEKHYTYNRKEQKWTRKIEYRLIIPRSFGFDWISIWKRLNFYQKSIDLGELESLTFEGFQRFEILDNWGFQKSKYFKVFQRESENIAPLLMNFRGFWEIDRVMEVWMRVEGSRVRRWSVGSKRRT